MVDGMHTFWLKKEDFKELYSKCRISGIVGNVRIYENSLIIQKYFRTPLKRGKKFSYPMKMLQNILVPPLFHSAPVSSIKNDRSLRNTYWSVSGRKESRKRTQHTHIVVQGNILRFIFQSMCIKTSYQSMPRTGGVGVGQVG